MMIITFIWKIFKTIIESVETPYIFVLGDFNADVQSDSVFGTELVEFCNLNKLDFIDKCLLPSSFLPILARPMAQAVKRSEEAIRADAMASNLLNNDYDSFWTDVKKLNSSNSIISNLIGGISGESNITNLWKKKIS